SSRAAIANADDGGGIAACQGGTFNGVTVHGELGTGEGYIAVAVVDSDGAGGALENDKLAVFIGDIDRAVHVGPVVVGWVEDPDAIAAIDDAVVIVGGIVAVPKVEFESGFVDEVDLVGDGILHVEFGSGHWNGADLHPIVGE